MSNPRHAAPGQTFDCHAEFYRNSAYRQFPQEHRTGGSLGVSMLEAQQGPIDMIDSAVPDLTICQNLQSGREVVLDFGDGLKQFDHPADQVVCLIPAFSKNRFKLCDPHHIRSVSIKQTAVDALFDRHGVPANAADALVGRLTERRDLCGLLNKLWSGMAQPDGSGGLLIDGLTQALLAQLTSDNALSPLGYASSDTRIMRVVDYIEAHLAEPLSVTELAAIATMSAGHFSRCFKATVGEPVWAYVQRRRCERAKDLLLHSREPLAEIAYRTGFANQAHMTTSLKDRYGATPGKIRKDRA